MPILETKYNFNPYNNYNKLKTDLCNNSFIYSNHIFTCDISDTLNDDNKPNKIYLTNKASFLIHPFSKASNCVSHFNNPKESYKYKNNLCAIPNNALSSHNTIQTQKALQKQLHTSSSNYTNNYKTVAASKELANNNNAKPWHNASDRYQNNKKINKGVDIKHNSYDRYLARKKSQYLKTEPKNESLIAKYGNKTQKFSILTNNNNCIKNC